MEAINGRAFVLLLLSVICTAFGGLQSIALLQWLQPLLLFQFFYHVRILDQKKATMIGLVVLTLLCQTLGYTIAWAGQFNSPYFTPRGLLITFVLSLVFWIILLFAFMTTLFYQRRFPLATSSHPFAFPCVWTMIWHIEASFAPIGASGNPAYSQHVLQPLVLTVALWGLDGIVFFMSLTATLIHQRIVLRHEGGQKSWYATTPWGATSRSALNGGLPSHNHTRNWRHRREIEDGDIAEESESVQGFASKVRQHDHLVHIWFGILLVFFLYSGVRQTIFSGSFFQKGITETIKPTVGVSCILREPTELYEDSSHWAGPRDFLWDATLERARAGDAFIVWSETATVVEGTEGEESLLSKAREILASELAWRENLKREKVEINESSGPYLGLSYTVKSENTSSYNVFTLLAPDGSVGFRYEKSHLVPVVEGDYAEGPGELMAVKTPFGTVSAAIGFDFQFPRLHESASYMGVSIMLQPSLSRGRVPKVEYMADTFRGLENGFTIVRCSAMGVSAVVTPYNEVIDFRESAEPSVVTMQLPISPKIFTLYPYGGFLFGIAVATVAMKYMFMAWLPLTWVHAVSNIFPGSINEFFAGDSRNTQGIVVMAYQKTMTATRSIQRSITRYYSTREPSVLEPLHDSE